MLIMLHMNHTHNGWIENLVTSTKQQLNHKCNVCQAKPHISQNTFTIMMHDAWSEKTSRK